MSAFIYSHECLSDLKMFKQSKPSNQSALWVKEESIKAWCLTKNIEMEKFWQICELQDSLQLFTELSVAAVPEIWIVKLPDGSYICYWPKENAGKKIRRFDTPNKTGEWKTYKCRILMDGGISITFFFISDLFRILLSVGVYALL